MEKLNEAVNYLSKIGIHNPDTGIILGTGLHNFTNYVKVEKEIPYAQIPGFPDTTVEFHSGKLLYGFLGTKQVIIMQGRFHQYEGFEMHQIVFPVRVMKLLGIKNLILTNAAGGINLNFKKGDLVLIDDHINLLNGNPLIGTNNDQLGTRFPDMSEPYNKKMQLLIKTTAAKLGIVIKAGIYVAVPGPNLETRAEYRYLKIIGADMVGMSTVPEVIAANHMSLPCAAISVITDECDPENLSPVDISEIIQVAKNADIKLGKLLSEVISVL